MGGKDNVRAKTLPQVHLRGALGNDGLQNLPEGISGDLRRFSGAATRASSFWAVACYAFFILP